MTLEYGIIEMKRHTHKNLRISENKYETAEFVESKFKELKIPYKPIGEIGIMVPLGGVNLN
jgi:hypothetical protein